MASSSVLGRTAPCDVPQGYASVALLPAALLDGHFEHPARPVRDLSNFDTCDGRRSQNEFFRNLLENSAVLSHLVA